VATAFTRTTRSLSNDTSKYALVFWLLGTILLSAWLAWFFFARITVYEFSAKARLEINRSPNPIATPVSGTIIALSVSLGQNVKAGDVLVELDASAEKLRLKEEQTRLTALPLQIANLKNEINVQEQSRVIDHEGSLAATQSARSRFKEASAASEFANDNYRRLSGLKNEGSVPVIEILKAQMESSKLDSVKHALLADIHRMEMDAKTKVTQKQSLIENLKREVAKMTGELAATHATISRLQLDVDKHLIRAPVSGTIGDLPPIQVGSVIAAGEKLGVVVAKGELRIVADFNPASVLGRVQKGQVSQMRLDGFPWTQYGGIKAKVSKVASEIRDNLIRVELTPEITKSSPISYQHGLPGTVEVSIEQTSPAILVLRAVGQILANPKPTQASFTS
jgi:multidrug resistance efflux pump